MVKRVLYAGILVLLIPLVSLMHVTRSDHALARYDDNGKMVSIANIFGLKKGIACTSLAMKGRITSVEYDTNTQITNFFLSTEQGSHENIYLTGVTFDKRLPPDDVKKLPSLVFKSNTVQVQIYACGAAGSHKEAEQIAGVT